MRLHMREEWLKLARAIKAESASETQQRDMERVFMSGAFALYTRLMRTLDPSEEPTAEDLKMMGEIDAEFKHFFGSLKDVKR